MEFAAAMTTTKKIGKQGFSAAHGSAAHEALTIGIVGDQALIPQTRPTQYILVKDQSLPSAALASKATDDPPTSNCDRHAASGAPDRIGASGDWVRKHVMKRVVDGKLPCDGSPVGAVSDRRQRQAFLAHPKKDLPCGLELGEFREDELACFLDASIRILLDRSCRTLRNPTATVRKSSPLRAFCFKASSDRRRKCESSISLVVPFMPSRRRSFGRRGSSMPSSPTISLSTIPQNSRSVCQSRPFAGEPRCLDRNHGAHASLADCSQQLLEAWPCDPEPERPTSSSITF
ncbi:hypothetical protein [Mesorhizobium sp. WSM3868]|uniref:hypothetical protein n=1 Tax=Mesorhizobium sp. WSM3868 TaxID=2029405 RepID=UPI0015C82943|nr:hypothetical protein [Mesorhizobium sp. WSM3868]